MYSASLQFESLRKPVSPRDCGLAIAIPLGRDAFLDRLNRERDGNFVQTFSRGLEKLPADLLWRRYEPYASYARQVADMAQGIGVLVVLDARIEDFTRLFGSCSVVTLVAHWKSALFKPADILDPAKLSSALRDPQSDLSSVLSAFTNGTQPAPERPEPACLADTLNDAMLSGVDIAGNPNSQVRLGTITRAHSELSRRRQMIEAAGRFAGGPSAEFFDGFYLLQAVVDSVPVGFEGLLDLTVCNSVLLAESIRRARPGCAILANEDLAFLDFRLALQAEIFRSLQRTPEQYEDVVYRIRKELKEVTDESIKRSSRRLLGFWSAFRRRN